MEKSLEQKISEQPAEKVTLEYMKSRILDVKYHKIGETVTICHMVLDNGFSVRGESACVKPENYDEEIGQEISYNNAVSQLWPFFGFLLAENGTLKK